MRCIPRRKKQLWIFFLLFVCLVGVYLSYNHLSDGRKDSHGRASLPYNPQLERSHKQLREKAQAELMRAKSRLGINKGIQEEFEDHPSIDTNAAAVGLRDLEADDDYITPDERMARLKLLLIDLSPTNWKTALDVDDMILQLKSELFDLEIDSEITCKEITALKPGGYRYRSHYGKKYVDHLSANYFKAVVVKSPGKDTQLKIECMQMDYNEKRCSVMSNYKLMRELVYLLVLDSPSIVKLNGFCLRGEKIDPLMSRKGVMIVTEAGEEAMLGTLMQFPRTNKLNVIEALLNLLLYMESSPVGSLGFDKLHMQDFVLFGVDLKLVDLDNIHIGEIACVEDIDCRIPEMSRKEIKCQNNICKGRNAMNNFLWFHRIIFRHMLSPSPKKYEMEVNVAIEKAQNLEISAQDLLDLVKRWKENKDPRFEPVKGDTDNGKRADGLNNARQSNKNYGALEDSNNMIKRGSNGFGVKVGNSEWKERHPTPKSYPTPKPRSTPKPVKRYEDPPEAQDKPSINENENKQFQEKLVEYIRENHANYPVVMTSIFKKGAKEKPDYNKGATLFSKKRAREKSPFPVGDTDPQNKNSPPQTVKPSPQAEIQSCTKKVLNQTELGRTSREKRLLTHLGLKGVSEAEWKTFAKSVKIVRSQGLSTMSHKLVTGGRFRVVYDTNSMGLKKGEYLLEKGPTHHHVSFMIAHYLDRILGLYHVPPAVSRALTWNDIKDITGDKRFQELYANYNQSDVIQGVLTLPMPPVMKTEKFTISYQETIISTINPYSRTEKSQLEYILIWSLMKFIQPSHGILGYKGHLIHFEADTGFGNMKKYLQGYFYNCQFPNTVFKTLLCYKCSVSRRLPKICGLGEEVLKQVKESGIPSQDLQIGKYKEKQLMDLIDSNAAAVLTVIEHCMKSFSREKVLY